MKAQLVPLPYAYTELSPTIRQRTVHLHHDKHQNGYVKGGTASGRSRRETSTIGET